VYLLKAEETAIEKMEIMKRQNVAMEELVAKSAVMKNKLKEYQ